MADDERRGERTASRRREPTRSQRSDPAIIDASAEMPAAEPAQPAADPSSPVETSPILNTADAEPTAAISERGEPLDPGKPADAAGPDAGESRSFETAGFESSPNEREPTRPSIVPALAVLVVAILAAGWIYLYNELSAVQSDGRAQIADLQTKIAALEARPVPDTAALTQRVDTASAQAQEKLQALTRRFDSLPANGGVDPKQVQALQVEVNGVKGSVGTLQNTVAALPKPDLSHVDQQIGDLGQKLSAVQTAVGAIPHIDLGPLTGKVDGLASKVETMEARLKPLESEAEAARSPQRLAERRAAPVAVTAQAIVEAITAGQAFPHEFAALQALGADPVKLAPLQTVAGTGAPSLRDLQANLADLRDAIVAQGAPKPSGSYMDRLMAGAGSLVQVRPLGSVVGDTPAAIVARLNDAIGADDLSRALHEWDTLPEASRNVSKGLADRIRVRLQAEEAAKGIAANAIGAMASPRG